MAQTQNEEERMGIENSRKFDLEDRLVQFASDCAIFCEDLLKDRKLISQYFGNQLLRSAGSSALNYGETQGAFTEKDYINKASICLKELKETRVNLKILQKTKIGNTSLILDLLNECEQLVAIIATLIKNKKQSSNSAQL